jgi:NodT family efflux transporter outer membrane factor (OMF) lipoprotein
MSTTHVTVRLARRVICASLLASTALALSACASVPNLGAAPKPTSILAYAARDSLSASTADWPQDRWWAVYGDTQLTQLIDEALAGAPDMTIAGARVRQAQAYAEQAGAALLPQVTGNAQASATKLSYNQQGSKFTAFAPHGLQSSGQVALNFGFDLDLWGKNRAALTAATSGAQAARADFAEARLTLSTSVAAAYADFVQLYADRDAAEDAVRVRAQSAALIDQRMAQGLENAAASEQARSGRASAEAELANLDEAIGLARDRLAALLGQGPDRGHAIERPTPSAIRPFGLPADLQAHLIGRRPDVVAARLRAEAAGHQIKSAKAGFYPDINLTAVLGAQSLGLNLLTKAGSEFGNAGPAITLPIFSGGRIEGAYRGARAGYDAAVATYDSAVVHALQDVADVAVSERALDLRLTKSREALQASQRAHDLAQLRYRGGLAPYLDVLTSEDALIANRRAVADLETRAFVLDITLVRALGGGFHAA